MITSRLVKFVNTLVSSSKPSVSYLAKITKNDNRTLIGRTLSRISRDLQVAKEEVSSSMVTRMMKYFPVPEALQWRVPVLHELLGARDNSLEITDFNLDEINTMIDDICTT